MEVEIVFEAIEEQQENRLIVPRQKLHKYVAICMGCFLLALATFPLAYWRVSRSGKYNAGAFNSLTPEQSQKSDFQKSDSESDR